MLLSKCKNWNHYMDALDLGKQNKKYFKIFFGNLILFIFNLQNITNLPEKLHIKWEPVWFIHAKMRALYLLSKLKILSRKVYLHSSSP